MNYAGIFIVQQHELTSPYQENKLKNKIMRGISLYGGTVVAAVILSACGGGSGSSLGPITVSGVALDGYIKGATICFDANSNNVCDTGEPSAVTGADGKYSITLPTGTETTDKHLIAIVPAGAYDSDAPTTPITKPYVMMAPVVMPSAGNTISTPVTPLTTAVSIEMKSGKQIARARIDARAGLSLPVDYDFLKDHVGTGDTNAHNVAKVAAAYLAANVGSEIPSATNLAAALTKMKVDALAAYNSTNVDSMVAAILNGTTTPASGPTTAPTAPTAAAGDVQSESPRVSWRPVGLSQTGITA